MEEREAKIVALRSSSVMAWRLFSNPHLTRSFGPHAEFTTRCSLQLMRCQGFKHCDLDQILLAPSHQLVLD